MPSNAVQKSAGDRYLQAWDALGALLTQGRSLSGRERNCCYLNTHEPTFANVSSASGFDFPSDTRGITAVDWDHDGDLDVWLSNRTSPRLQFLRNELIERRDREDEQASSDDRHWVGIRLRGTSGNRDAIGARVVVHARGAKTARTLRAGEGYLSQSSKCMHFGLGAAASIEFVEVTWPGGATERIEGVGVDRWFEIVEGTASAAPWTRPGTGVSIARNRRANLAEPIVQPIRIVAHRRLPIPRLDYLDERSETQAIEPSDHAMTLVVVWATWCAPCLHELSAYASERERLADAGINLTTLCVDDPSSDSNLAADGNASSGNAFETLRQLGVSWPGGIATDATKTKIDLLQRILVSRENPLSIPMSMLLDKDGRLAVIYRGAVPFATLQADAAYLSQPGSDTRDAAVPLAGRWFVNPVPPDLMSMFEKLMAVDLPDDALEYLEQHLLSTIADERSAASIWPPMQVADAYRRVGIKLAQRPTRRGAERAFARAIEIAPDVLLARAAMASLMQAEGRMHEALLQYEEMQQRQPNNPLILNDMAWILATIDDPQVRDPARAIVLAEQACELTTYRSAPILDTLAATYASAGRFDDAARTQSKAIDVARQSGRDQTLPRMLDKLKLYEAKRSDHELQP